MNKSVTLKFILLFIAFLTGCSKKDISHEELFNAVKQGEINKVETYIAKGRNLNIRNKSKHTLLMHSICFGRSDIGNLLIKHGADIELIDDDGWTAVSWCALKNNTSLLKTLIEKDVNINHIDAYTYTSLLWASKKGHTDIVNLLLMHESIKINYQTSHGFTALILASNKHHGIVTMLLEKGANVSVADSNNKTALDYAMKADENNIIELLRKYGAKSKITKKPNQR